MTLCCPSDLVWTGPWPLSGTGCGQEGTRNQPPSPWALGGVPDRVGSGPTLGFSHNHGLGQMPGPEMGDGSGEPRGSAAGADAAAALSKLPYKDGRPGVLQL